MFDYPIPPLYGGLYARLGLGPESTAEEINEARQELSSRLKSQLKVVQRELDAVYRQVPGLREAWKKVEAEEAKGADGDPARLRDAQLEQAELEESAQRIRADFRELREKAADLERQIHEASLIPIQNPGDRLAYDRSHPPFEIIKLSDGAASSLDDRRTMLAMVRRELSEFVEQYGEEVFKPSDLTRVDFLHDFTPYRSLDKNS